MSPSDAGPSDEYNVPRSSKIKLKETKVDKAARLYRKEQRRYQREQERISRANGYAVSPPRLARSESISPPRKRSAPTSDVLDDDEPGYRWMGGYGHTAETLNRKREEAERMAWLEQEEMSRGDPFSVGYGYAQPTPDTNVPHRHRRGASPGKARRDATREVDFQGGAVPDIGSMTENEYTEWVREGMFRRKNKAEVEERERRQSEKEEKERQKVLEEERQMKEEKRRIRRLEKQKGKDEEDRRGDQRKRYKLRWQAVTATGGDIEESQLGFDDVPWPIYRTAAGYDIDDFDKDRIRDFMRGIAGDGGEEDDLKKVLRDAIRAYHPDRFFGRILPRIREIDRDKVKEGVERCSRVINALAAEGRS